MWTLEKLRDRIRYILGLSREQLSDEDLTLVLLEYWTCSLPMEFREEQLFRKDYQLITEPGVDSYPIGQKFKVLSPSAFCDGRPISLFYNHSLFLSVRPDYSPPVFIKEMDGVETSLSYTFNKAVAPSSVVFFYRDGDRTIIAPFGVDDEGLVQYSNGVFSVQFFARPPQGSKVYAKAIPATFSPPSYIYVGSDSVQVWPVPKSEHLITMGGMQTISLQETGTLSIRDELGNVVIYGTILELLAQRNDLQAADQYRPVYETYIRIAMGKRVIEAASSRTLPTDV